MTEKSVSMSAYREILAERDELREEVDEQRKLQLTEQLEHLEQVSEQRHWLCEKVDKLRNVRDRLKRERDELREKYARLEAKHTALVKELSDRVAEVRSAPGMPRRRGTASTGTRDTRGR